MGHRRGAGVRGVAAACLLAAVLTAGIAAASGSTDAGQARAARCPAGEVDALIQGKRVCLRRGKRCTKRLDRQYHRHGFHCHNGRLTGGDPAGPKPMPSAGRVVAKIPVPSWGGIAVGAGSVWVASTLTHTLVRIDPGTNAVVATIPVGTGMDVFHGPTRVGFGHGTVWVLDGAAECSCVHRVDPATNRVVATIPLGTPVRFRVAPLALAVRPEAVWFALRDGTEDATDGSVVRVDPLTNRVASRIGLGTSPDFGGPTGIAASSNGVWAGVPSMKAVVRVDPATDAPVATIEGLTCGEGQLAADEVSVWVADCTAVRRIDPATNSFVRAIPIPGATGGGVRGIELGLGSVWVQAGPLVRIDPARNEIVGVTPLDPSLVWGEYSIAIGFGSIWLRQMNSIVRVKPS